MHCILGYVDIGTSTGVQSGFVYFHEKKHGKRQQNFLLFLVLLRKNEQTLGVLSFKIKFSSKMGPPYCILVCTVQYFG
jgi:hypothetical protein